MTAKNQVQKLKSCKIDQGMLTPNLEKREETSKDLGRKMMIISPAKMTAKNHDQKLKSCKINQEITTQNLEIREKDLKELGSEMRNKSTVPVPAPNITTTQINYTDTQPSEMHIVVKIDDSEDGKKKIPFEEFESAVPQSSMVNSMGNSMERPVADHDQKLKSCGTSSNIMSPRLEKREEKLTKLEVTVTPQRTVSLTDDNLNIFHEVYTSGGNNDTEIDTESSISKDSSNINEYITPNKQEQLNQLLLASQNKFLLSPNKDLSLVEEIKYLQHEVTNERQFLSAEGERLYYENQQQQQEIAKLKIKIENIEQKIQELDNDDSFGDTLQGTWVFGRTYTYEEMASTYGWNNYETVSIPAVDSKLFTVFGSVTPYYINLMFNDIERLNCELDKLEILERDVSRDENMCKIYLLSDPSIIEMKKQYQLELIQQKEKQQLEIFEQFAIEDKLLSNFYTPMFGVGYRLGPKTICTMYAENQFKQLQFDQKQERQSCNNIQSPVKHGQDGNFKPNRESEDKIDVLLEPFNDIEFIQLQQTIQNELQSGVSRDQVYSKERIQKIHKWNQYIIDYALNTSIDTVVTREDEMKGFEEGKNDK